MSLCYIRVQDTANSRRSLFKFIYLSVEAQHTSWENKLFLFFSVFLRLFLFSEAEIAFLHISELSLKKSAVTASTMFFIEEKQTHKLHLHLANFGWSDLREIIYI